MTDDEKLTEDQAWEIALRDHPDLRGALESDSLPEELVDEQGNGLRYSTPSARPKLAFVLATKIQHAIMTRSLSGI